jgi:glutaredoxin
MATFRRRTHATCSASMPARRSPPTAAARCPSSCAACDNARVYLRQRGVPFSERVVEGPDDLEALKRATGLDKVPVLMIGRERFAGFTPANWARALDYAGYPSESKLPPDFRPEPPQPLVARASGPASAVGPAAATR